MKKSKFILLIIVFSFLSFALFGCSDNNENSEMSNKIESEINYLDKEIIGIMNKLNNITLDNYEVKSQKVEASNSQGNQSDSKKGENQSSNEQNQENKDLSSQDKSSIKVLQLKPSNILVIDKNDIDWPQIKSEAEMIYTAWNTILLDLYNINIADDEILNFSLTLDNIIISLKEQNKADTLIELANLYSKLPIFMEKINVEESKKNILKTKSNVLFAYAYLEDDDWNTVNQQLQDADENYRKVINDVEYIKNRQETATKVYVLIKELENSITKQDKDIFYIKYKNLLNSM